MAGAAAAAEGVLAEAFLETTWWQVEQPTQREASDMTHAGWREGGLGTEDDHSG